MCGADKLTPPPTDEMDARDASDEGEGAEWLY